jgi:hypothetical protein
LDVPTGQISGWADLQDREGNEMASGDIVRAKRLAKQNRAELTRKVGESN